jgi:hypothetical protein
MRGRRMRSGVGEGEVGTRAEVLLLDMAHVMMDVRCEGVSWKPRFGIALLRATTSMREFVQIHQAENMTRFQASFPQG